MSSPIIAYTLFPAERHRNLGHVERPERIQGIIQSLLEAGFMEDGPYNHLVEPVKQEAALIHAAQALVSRVHSYASTIQQTIAKGMVNDDSIAVLADEDDPDGATYATNSSYWDAVSAVGAAIRLVEISYEASRRRQQGEGIAEHIDDDVSHVNATANNVPSASSTIGFGINRPPGHHATPSTPLGFCIFNNIAAAAFHARESLGAERVLILDFDVHNGNGTADIFWSDPHVAVIDIHETSCIYHAPPWTPSGIDALGGGDARGTIVNIPFPKGAGQACVELAFSEVVLPFTHRFKPDIILVSAGYDAHVEDPFQLLQYTNRTYHYIAQNIKKLAEDVCKGRLVFLLEGGYNPTALGEAVTATWMGLLDDGAADSKQILNKKYKLEPEPFHEVQTMIAQLKRLLQL